jgi:hypothetical protein
MELQKPISPVVKLVEIQGMWPVKRREMMERLVVLFEQMVRLWIPLREKQVQRTDCLREHLMWKWRPGIPISRARPALMVAQNLLLLIPQETCLVREDLECLGSSIQTKMILEERSPVELQSAYSYHETRGEKRI